MNCILHIGLPKTASTYLQKRVFPRISEQCPRILYDKPTFDRLFKHVEECFVNEGKPLEPHLENLKAHLADLHKAHPDRTLLVSREQIASLHHIRYDAYHEAVAEAFSGIETRVLIVARYQPDWLWSLYKHTAGKPIGYTPARFFRMKGRGEGTRFSYHTGADPLRRDFWALYERFSARFGEARLFFFEEFIKNERRFVEEMFEGYGLQFEADWSTGRVNTTVPENALGFFITFCLPHAGFRLEAHGGEPLPRIRNGLRRVTNGIVNGWNRSLMGIAQTLPGRLLDPFVPEQPFYRKELKRRFDERNAEMSARHGVFPPATYTDGNHNYQYDTRQNEQIARTT